MEIEADDDQVIRDVRVIGGCNGNLKGICSLIKGQKLETVRQKLNGITCGNKPTSCPDQLSKAIAELEKQY